MDLEELRVTPGKRAHLDDRSPRDTVGLGDKVHGLARLDVLRGRLADLHARLWAEHERSVLLVLQALDGGGKDGTIRSVLTGLNPQGVRIANFKAPSHLELDHDYLWRVHAHLPARGELGVFNRSHYEDVLAARVLELVPEERWRRRYRHIVEWERMLVDEGTVIVKCYLHISTEHQLEVFRERLSDPAKRWKFRAADLAVRDQWGLYQQAYEDAIEETSSEHAPWHVIPADRNWVRNACVAGLLVEVLERLDPQFPPPEPGMESVTL